jgi:hypothetical protein
MAGKLALSKEAVALTVKTVQDSAAADSLEAALEIGYQGFGDIACLEAAKEGVTAFLQKRKPVFEKVTDAGQTGGPWTHRRRMPPGTVRERPPADRPHQPQAARFCDTRENGAA